jgi:hypothetical protein
LSIASCNHQVPIPLETSVTLSEEGLTLVARLRSAYLEPHHESHLEEILAGAGSNRSAGIASGTVKLRERLFPALTVHLIA